MLQNPSISLASNGYAVNSIFSLVNSPLNVKLESARTVPLTYCAI